MADRIDIFGNEKLSAFFKNAYSNNKLAHAYILEGGKGSGKHTFALYLACLFACGSIADKPCFMCESCRKISNGISPDVIEIGLADDKKYISVDQIREMRSNVFLKPNEEEVKTYIIKDAHLMNSQAQNILLKVLEEPPHGVFFLLLCENSSNILSTVKSRAPVLKMQVFDGKETEKYLLENYPKAVELKKKDEESFRLIIKISGGRIGEALRLIEGSSKDGVESIYKKSKEFLKLAANNKPFSDFLFFVRTMASDREKFQDILNFSVFGLRDIIAVKKVGQAGVELLFFNSYDEAVEYASGFTSRGVIKVYDEILKISGYSYSNANLNNLLNYTAIKIKEKSDG